MLFTSSCAAKIEAREQARAKRIAKTVVDEVNVPAIVQEAVDKVDVPGVVKKTITTIQEERNANQVVRELQDEISREDRRRISGRRAPVDYRYYRYMPDTSTAYGTEALLAEISKEIAGKVYYQLKEDGEKLNTARVAVVGAVPLADFKRETEFGRIIGEYLLTDLADRGLKVTELRLGREINILPRTGEFIMSRNIGELAYVSPEIDYVVVSTFSNTVKTLIVQGRMVDLNTGLIKTSWRHVLPMNRELVGMFRRTEEPFKIAVRGVSH
ncbi:MAG: hypothetical protein KKG47_15420 [Proteobacteria bacterium]|nr:hypothetical protein [Pseudomonadota bacterium]MBU1737980.1 hypothetical protein [Pseudomonadota bacterium]